MSHPTRVIPVEKVCAHCGVVKPANDFCRSARMKSGLYSYCRPCSTAKATAWHRANPDGRKRHEETRGPRTTEERWAVGLWVKYRMRPSDYEAMSEAQGGKCAICGTGEGGGVRGKLHVDHNHVTGHVRGLLCQNCNLALGHFKDDVVTMRTAIEYLDR